MAVTTEVQESRAVTVVIEKEKGFVGIMKVAYEASELLSETDKIQITGQLPGRKPLIRPVGGGEEDEGISERLEEIKSLLSTLKGWLDTARIGEKLEVTISA
jgi:hypothetical protein